MLLIFISINQSVYRALVLPLTKALCKEHDLFAQKFYNPAETWKRQQINNNETLVPRLNYNQQEKGQ